MLPMFLYPLAFIGLLGVPALVAIYLFRNRFRRQVVSSLMLWIDPRESREGGRRLRQLQTPLLFLLELLVLLLLVFAAADPYLHWQTSSRPLIVVLDDSYSMLAGDPNSPRRLAEQALADELRRVAPHSVRFLLAGDRPQVLGEPARTPSEAMAQLAGWHCRSSTARLDETLALAAELGGDLSLLLVLTDQPPPSAESLGKGRVQWWAFGKSRGNLAIVNAARSEREGLDRCLLEIQNLSDAARSCTLVVQSAGRELRKSVLNLASEEKQRLILQLPAETGEIVARIDEDELPLDNQAVLLPTRLPTIRVAVRLSDRRLGESLEKALQATRLAQLQTERPQLLFTDHVEEVGRSASAPWMVQFVSEKEATAYSGPFIFDRSHALLEGIGLQGVIWGAGKSERFDGTPLLMAGNIPLITESEQGSSETAARRIVRVRLRPDLSTLLGSPDWPILIWNLLTWRAAALPGLNRVNVRLGDTVTLQLAEPRDSLRLIAPDGPPRDLAVRGRQVVFRADSVGRHDVQAGSAQYAFAVNALNSDESDLRKAGEGRWGDWLDQTTLRLEYQPISWILLLLLLVLVLLHLLVMVRGRSDRASSSATGG